MEFPSVDVISSLAYSRTTSVLFSGNISGSVRSWSYPVANSDVRDYNIHTGSIVCVRVSPTENFLFTASDDGAIFVMSILPLENGKVVARRALDPSRYLDLILTSKSAIEEKALAERELLSKLKEAQNNTEYQIHMRQLHFEQDLKKVRLEADQRLQQEVAKYDELRKAKMALELKAQEEIQQLEKEHLKAAQDLEQLHERRAKDAAVKLEELTQEKDDTENSNEEHLKRLKETHSTTLSDINREWEEKLTREKERYEQLSREMDVMRVTHDEEVSQQEEEYEYEMAIGKDKSNKLLQIERDNTMSLKSDNSQYRRKQDMYLQEFQELQNTITEKDNVIGRHKKKMQELEDNIHLLNKEVEERNETIAQKESRIFEIKQKNQELEKFRFVLEYKINELREELEPQELTITDMKSQIKDMDEELQRTLKNGEDLKLTINDKKLHSDTLTTSVKRLKSHLAEKEKLIRTFVEDVHKIYTETDPADHKNVQQGLLTLYQTYVTGDSNRRITREDQERMQELARQRQYMERSLNIMKQKVVRSDDRNRIDVQRKVSENASLISELNNLRRLTKDQAEKIIGLENQLNSGTVKAAERLRNYQTSYINPLEGTKPSTATMDASPTRSAVSSPVNTKRMPSKTVSATSVVSPPMDKEPLTSMERSQLARLIMQREEDQRELELLRIEVKRYKESQASGIKASAPIKVVAQRTAIDPVPHPLRTSLHDTLPLTDPLPNIKSLSLK